jgi:hypothetical protein
VVAWLAYLYETTKISGQTAEQNVSSVNQSYETQELQPPGILRNAYTLFHDVRKALDGFTNTRLLRGGANQPSVKELGFIGSWPREQTIEVTRARLI